MRIGFDITQTCGKKTGCGYMAYSLICALAEIDPINEYRLFTSFGEYYWDPKCSTKDCGIKRQNLQAVFKHSIYKDVYDFWRDPPQDFEKILGNPDIIHSNNYYCPTSLKSARLVYTLHDLGFVYAPEWTTEINRSLCFQGVFNASLYADLIIAVSNFTRMQFLELFPHFPKEKIVVVYEGSRFFFKRRRIKCRSHKLKGIQVGRYWLNVGTIEPRKNLKGLLQAYSVLVQQTGSDMPLIHVGSKGWDMDDLGRIVNELGLSDRVIFLDYLGDNELQWLYENCFSFVYPSFYEGFGLPVLEAMSLGAPVITSNTTSLREVAGSACYLINPERVDEIAQAMINMYKNNIEREKLKTLGLQQAGQFSWIKSARELLNLYRNLCV